MRYIALPVGIVAIACGLLAGPTTARAAIETWVSGTGADTGTCQIAAPCRTFAYAHSQTNNNGSINVLSSGNFGPLIITKPISIVAQGVEAVINSASNTPAILIQAGPTAVVSLRGLTIDMRGTAHTGILHAEGGALHVQDCVIRKTGGNGISFFHNSGTKELYVADSMFSDGGNHGIAVMGGVNSGKVSVVIDRVRVENMAKNGILLEGGVNTLIATVRESVTSGNGGTGLFVVDEGDFAPRVHVMVDGLTSVNNVNGIRAFGAAAKIWMGNSTVNGNGTGLSTSFQGVIASYGTNKVDGNVTDGAPTGTIPMK